MGYSDIILGSAAEVRLDEKCLPCTAMARIDMSIDPSQAQASGNL